MVLTLHVFPGLRKPSATEHRVKNFAEIIGHYENFSNFVHGEHSDKSIGLKLSPLNLNTFIANDQIFNQLLFIELTLDYENVYYISVYAYGSRGICRQLCKGSRTGNP